MFSEDAIQDQMTLTIEDDPMLTTYNNPHNPFDDFKGWWKYDYFVLGWDTCGLLARRTAPTQYESETQKEMDALEAMKKIVRAYPYIFRLVTRKDYEGPRLIKRSPTPIGGSK